MESEDEVRDSMISQINEHLDLLNNEKLATVMFFLNRLESESEDDSSEDEEDSSEDSSDEEFAEPTLDPNSEEYQQLVAKLSNIALPPLN